MSWWSNFKKEVSKAYKSVDRSVGGLLPGGVSPSKVNVSTSSKKKALGEVFLKPSEKKAKAVAIKRGITVSVPSKKSSVIYSPYSSGRGATITIKKPTPQKISLKSSLKDLQKGGVLDIGKNKVISKEQIDKRTGKPFGILKKFERQKEGILSENLRIGKLSPFDKGISLAELSYKLKQQRELLRTKKERSRTGNINPLDESKLIALGFGSGLVDLYKDMVNLPESMIKILRNPKSIEALPESISKSAERFGKILRVSPGEALGYFGGQLVGMKGSSRALKEISELSSSELAKLNPKYVGKAEIGKKLKIKTGKGKFVELEVVGKIPKEKLQSQISKAGKIIKSAVSSQADALLGIIKKRKFLRKPIPGESNFNTATKRLLAQFDRGSISKSNLLKLDKLIKKQGGKGLLERSFFADPTGKIRPSRLGVIKEGKGNILDYFTEDIMVKKSKPQILLFEDVEVQKLPKSLSKIKTKLKRGVALSKKEADSLLKYQLKKSGKFKPVGFLSGESEITLAPGEILKRVKKVGVTVAEGKRIPIVKAEIFKPTGKIKKLLNKFKAGELTKAQTKQLDKLLKQKTGFNYGLSSSKKIAGKYINIKKISAGILSKISPKKPTIKIKTISPKYITPKKKILKPKKPISPKKRIPKKIKKSKIKGYGSKREIKKSSVVKPKKQISQKRPTSKSKKVVKRVSKISTYGKYKRVNSKGIKKPSILKTSKPVKRKYYKSKISKGKSTKYIKRPYSPKSPKKYKSPKSPKYPKSPGRPPRIRKTAKKKVTRKKANVGYYVYEKRGKRFYRLKGLPLTKKQAKDKLAYRIDNKISRTAKLIPVKNVKKFGKITGKQKGYFNKYKKNLRNYRIIRGKRIKTPLTYIEKKGKGVISTKGEKRQLALNRKAKARKTNKKKVKRVVIRKTRVRRTVKKKKINKKLKRR